MRVNGGWRVCFEWFELRMAVEKEGNKQGQRV